MKHQAVGYRRAPLLAFQEPIEPSWLELAHVDEWEDARTAWIVVTLDCNGELLSGASPAIKKRKRRHGIHRAALATLRALELFSSHQLSCELVDVACVTARSHPSVLVRVRVVSDDETAVIFGIARADGDFAEAAARAVLNAVNVYVHNLLAQA
jgi:hypothetical protein